LSSPAIVAADDDQVQVWRQLFAQRRTQIHHVILGLCQQRPQRLGDVRQPEVVGLRDALAVTGQLPLLKVKIQTQCRVLVGLARDLRNLDRGYATEEVDLVGQRLRVLELG
jgi:hypothetical protein